MDTLWFTTPSPLVYKRFPTEIKSFQLFHNSTLKHIHSQSVGFSVVGYQQRGRHVQALEISKLDAETQAMNQTPICEDLCTSVIGLSDTIVGVLGGGHLGRMLCQAASKMGVKVAVLDPMENCPASAIAHRHVVGSFRDTNAVQKFAKECGVLTVEIEHVDVDTLDVLEKQGMDCQPNASTIQLIQGEKGFVKTHQLMKRAVSVAGASVHWYEKPEMRKRRKMGHITVVGSSMDLVRAWMKLIVDGETQNRSLGSRSTQPLENSSKASAAASSGNDNSGYGARAWKRWGSRTQRTQKTTTQPVISGPGPKVGIIMGSDSDLPVMKDAAQILNLFDVSYEITIVSAHRTPDRMAQYAKEARGRGIKVIIAGAGGAAHLPGMTALMTTLPVLGVPIRGSSLDGMDSLPSIVQMPTGTPVATFAIQSATNAALFAVRILAIINANLHKRLSNYQMEMKETVIKEERLETIGWEPQRTHASIINRSLHGSPEVGIIMGSDSDLPVMMAAAEILKSFNVSYEITIESAHQTPDRMAEYAKEAHGKGIKVIIAGAGGAAHLPGMIASMTTLTVLGVPVKGSSLDEMDSLLSIVQMREGVPVAAFAIQNATNAALFAVQILALINANLHERLSNYQIEMEETVIKKAERLETIGWEAYLGSLSLHSWIACSDPDDSKYN